MALAVLGLALVVAISAFAAQGDAAVGQTGSFGSYGFGNGQFANGTMVGVDPVDGSIYAGDLTQQNTKEQREFYRIQKFSPSGTYEASVQIPRFSDAPTNEHLVELYGIAVDPTLHRFYVLEGVKEFEKTGEPTAKQIRVYSTIPKEGKLVAPEGGPATLPMPTGTEVIWKPRSISVDPSNHELVVFGETKSTPHHSLVQRVSSSGTIGKRFVDSTNKLSPSASKRAFGATVGTDGTIYALDGNRARPASANLRAWEIPASMTEIKEVPGFAAAAESEAWPNALWSEPFTPNTGGPQVAISSDGKTLYWKEEFEGPTVEKGPGNMVIRGFSLTEDATTVVYGGGSTEGSCRIATTNAGFGVTGEAGNEKVVVFDYGQLNEEKAEAPNYGGKILTFGQGGSGCFDPVAKFTANGTEGTAKVKAGETVTFDASGSELASGPTKTAGARRELIWKFGDGTEEVVKASGSGEAAPTVTHKYATAGTYTATLQIHLKTPTFGNPQPVSHTVEVSGGAPAEFKLTVTKEGTGSGTVISEPTGINCGTECSHSYAEGTQVKLTGTPAAGSKAVVWSGCTTVNGAGECEVTMSAAKEVKATFNAIPQFLLTVTKEGTGSGTVTSNPTGINCGGECSHSYAEGTLVKLAEAPAAGSEFVAWENCEKVTAGECEVTMSAAKEVKATFKLKTQILTVTKEGTGSGTVTSNPPGISCGTECSHAFTEGSLVKLTGAPAAGSKAVAWSGCDTINGAGECEVTMSAAKEVKATFNTIPLFLLTVKKEGSGSGTVTSNPTGINCGGECSHSYAEGTLVTLTGTPTAGSNAVSWSGCDKVTAGECEVTMSAAKEVKATFNLTTFSLTVTKEGSGSGTVMSSPTGINCGGECSHSYNEGTLVKLTGTPAAGSKAVAWSGCDTINGAGECEVTMSAAKEVKATFNTIPLFLLTVKKEGSGSGTVTSNPTGINCGTECSHSYAEGTTVTLTGTPTGGSKSVSWSGCSNVTAAGECEVTMSAAKEVKATFTAIPQFALTVNKEGAGSGTVVSNPAGINCGTECGHTYAEGTLVKLTGTPATGSKAVVWSGCDTINGANECEVTMNAAKEVTATFQPETQTLNVIVEGSGSGTVTSNPAGINCGTECSHSYAEGTLVKLAGAPGSGSKAAAWSGCDTINGANECEVTLNATRTVKATFQPEGGTTPIDCSGADITGEGSSLQGLAQTNVWAPGFKALCGGSPSVKYESTSSGAGLAAWGFGGGTFHNSVAFVGTDEAPNAAQIKNAESASGSKILVIPVAQTAIGIVVNPPTNCSIEEITNKQLESIMRGNIKSWAKVLTASGPGCAAPITRVVRAEGSGTTYQFKNYLQQINPAPLACTEGGKTWAQLEEIGAGEKPNTVWPENGSGGCSATQLSPIVTAAVVTKKVNTTEGSIGYAGLPDIEANKNTAAGAVNPNGDTAALRLQNNGLSNKPANAAFAAPATEDMTANCSGIQYGVPAAGRDGQSGEDVDWSQVFGGRPAVGGETYPLCALTYDVALVSYSKAGFTAATEKTVRSYLAEYVTAKYGQEGIDMGKQFYLSLPGASEAQSQIDVLGAARLAAGKIGF